MSSPPENPLAPDPRGSSVPPPLSVAASLAAVEGAVLVIVGIALLPSLEGERLVMGLTSAAFFVVYGVALGFCAWKLYRRASWARAPVVMAQVLQILVTAGFWGGGATLITVMAVLAGLVTIAGVFHPDSLAALEGPD